MIVNNVPYLVLTNSLINAKFKISGIELQFAMGGRYFEIFCDFDVHIVYSCFGLDSGY